MKEFCIAILTSSFTLLGVGVTLWFEKKRNTLEHCRWYTEHFFGQKLQSLRELHVVLVDCHFTLNFYGNCPPSTLVEFKEKIEQKIDAYLHKSVMASIYLNDKENIVFASALAAFRQASMSIWLHLPDNELPVNKASYSDPIKNMNWGLFTSTYEGAVKLLKDKLSPEALVKMETQNSHG